MSRASVSKRSDGLGVPGCVGSSVSTKEYCPAPGVGLRSGTTSHPVAVSRSQLALHARHVVG